MKSNYEEGTVCIVDKKKAGLKDNFSDYVYIKEPKAFGRYKCYPCDIYGEIDKSFKEVIIHESNLYKRSTFPVFNDDDLLTCVKVITAFKVLNDTKEIELDIIKDLIVEFSGFLHKVTLNVLVGKLL